MSVNAITGYSGIYSAQAVSNPSIRYGRNAANNMERYIVRPVSTPEYEIDPADDEIFATALEKFATALEQDEFTPLKYRYQYSSLNKGEFDKFSALGAGYEEMGKQTETPVKKLTKLFKKYYPKEKLSAAPIDTNKNGKVEVEEYTAFLALADIKSKDKNSKDTSLLDGNITDKGAREAVNCLAIKSSNPIRRFQSIANSRKTLAGIQKQLDLNETGKEFKKQSLNFLA